MYNVKGKIVIVTQFRKVILMYCTKCGNKNDDSSNFCGNCGATLKNAEKNGVNYIEPDKSNQQQQNYSPYNPQQNINADQNSNYGQPNYNQRLNQNANFNQNRNTSRFNPMAIAGFITSCGCVLFGGLAGFVGLILSLVGFHQTIVREEKGKGFAVAGIIIGCLSVAVTILLIIYILNANPYEFRNFLNDYYDEFDYGTSAVKDLFSMLKQ